MNTAAHMKDYLPTPFSPFLLHFQAAITLCNASEVYASESDRQILSC